MALEDDLFSFEDVEESQPEEAPAPEITELPQEELSDISSAVEPAQVAEETEPVGDTSDLKFKQLILSQMSDPNYDTLTPEQKISNLNSIYQSRNWDPSVDPLLKSVSTVIWDSAGPEEAPNFDQLVGPPLLTPSTEDVEKATNEWKMLKLQELDEKGINTDLYGQQLDTYMDNVIQAEKDAYTARNRSTTNWALNRAGNYIRETSKGVAQLVTEPVAGAVRLTGGLVGKGQETADAISNIPEMVLGTPAKDFLYNIDEDGYPIQNPDGSFQTHWQAQASQIIGNIGGMIASLGIGAVAGVSSKALAAANVTADTLGMANQSFKTVYEETGSLGKAYSTLGYVLPAAAVGSIGGIGIVAGQFRPALRGLRWPEQGRYIAGALTRNAAIGAASNAASDIIQQTGEVSQTGRDYDLERTAVAAGAGAAGSGIAGTAFDLLAARADYNKGSILRAEKLGKVSDEITQFSYSLDSETSIISKPQDMPEDMLVTLGVTATPNPEGGVTLTKKTDLMINEAADLPTLIQTLEDQPTPDEIREITKTDPVLGAKLGRPEHANNIRATERAIAQKLNEDPGALPVRFNQERNGWENVETGRFETYLKDLLHVKEEQVFNQDLSDISDVTVLDEDVILSEDLEESRQGFEQEVTDTQGEIQTLNESLTTSTEQLRLAREGNRELEGIERQRQRLEKRLSEQNKRLEELGPEREATEPSQEATNQAKGLQSQIESARADVLRISNEKSSAPTPEAKKEVNTQLEAARSKVRSFQSELLKLRKKVRDEKENARAFEAAQGLQTQRKNINKKTADLQTKLQALGERKPVDLTPLEKGVADLTTRISGLEERGRVAGVSLKELGKRLSSRDKTIERIGKVKSKGLGALITSGDKKELIIPSGLTPEAKTQVTAHELAHVIQDKVKFSPEDSLAIETKLAELNVRGLAEPASEVAKQVFLPEVLSVVKIPEGVTVEGLDKPSRKALTSKREFLANQIGAVILKRSGKDIGNYPILPVIESVLADTKLPSVGEQSGKSVQSGGVPKEAIEKTSTSSPGAENKPSTRETTAGLNPTGRESLSVKGATGELGETAYSKTIRESVPEISPTEYPKWSRAEGFKDALRIVDQEGTNKILDELSKEEVYRIDPNSRVHLTEAVLERARQAAKADPTPSNLEALARARDLRASVGTTGAQAISMLQRVRGTENFGDFLVQLKREYENAGLKAPEFTDFMVKELKALYQQTKALPPGVLQNNYVMKLMEKSLAANHIVWPEFFKSMIRTNLLSGFGTQSINATSGAWMSWAANALSHPFMGGGLMWKAISRTLPLAHQQAMLVLEGKAGNTMVGALVDPTPLRVRDYSNPARAAASTFNKIGTKIYQAMQAFDTLNKTIVFEQDLARQKYNNLKKLYGNNPEKFNAEVSKILLSPEDIKANYAQAEREGKAVGLELSEADKYARAYEILRQRDSTAEMLQNSEEFANSVSLRGDVVNPTSILFNELLTGLERVPLIGNASVVVIPFGRAMVRLTDYSMDFIPGNNLIDKVMAKYTTRGERSEALKERLRMGQKLGTGLALSALGLSQAGLITITGDDEIVLDRGGEGDSTGKPARTGAQFAEAKQRGIPPYSIVLPNGTTITYKDFPGFNAIMYGVYRANKAIEGGQSSGIAGIQFFRNAFTSAVPILGGMTTLNSPYTKLIDEVFNEESSEPRITRALEQIARSTQKQITPLSSLLNDIKTVFDSTPEEAYQDIAIQMVSGIPGAETMFGSKPALNYFGEPVEVPFGLQRIPGAKRVLGSVTKPTDEVALKAFEKGLIIPEVNKRAVNFKKEFFGKEEAGDLVKERYKTTYQERTGNAYTGSLTPDEWYAFMKATGPYIKRLTDQYASSPKPVSEIQGEFNKRVYAIRDNAMKRYIQIGKF